MYKNWSRLQPVLKFRKSVENERALSLADAKRRFRRGSEELVHLQNRYLSLKSDLLKGGKSDAGFIAVHGQYLHALSREMSQIEGKLVEMEGEMEAARKKLLQASKDRKIIKKIIEKSQEAQKESERASETKLLDEAGTTLYIRRTR